MWDYILWALPLAGGIGTIIGLPGLLAFPGPKENLALWLTAGDNSQWADKFNDMFDRIMGPRHLSLHRFKNSAFATAISVAFLYLFMEYGLGLLSSRTDAQIGVGEVVIFALAINVVADYVSLIETRWLLGRFAAYRNWYVQLALLALDLIVSALLIWLAISVFRWLNSDDILMPLELIAGYTEFSIFFYSTFFTSIWAWVFCVSAWTIRVFSGLGLDRVLDVFGQPFAVLGLIASVLVFFILVLAKPVVEASMPEDVDAWLCLNFEGRICTHAARVSEDDLQRMERLKLACTTGDPTQCRAVLDGFEERLVAEAVPFLEAACWQSNDGLACNSLGFMRLNSIELVQDFDKAQLFFQRGCEVENWQACGNLGTLYLDAIGVKENFDVAKEYYELACFNGFAPACTALGYMFWEGKGVRKNFSLALNFFGFGCQHRDPFGCVLSARLHLEGQGVPKDPEKAITYFEAACDLNLELACEALGRKSEE